MTREASRAVSTYLSALRAGNLSGTGMVMFGRLPGFPAATDDPEIVEAAADAIAKRAAKTSAVLSELKLRSRVAELRDAARALRARDTDAEDAFVKFAAEYAQENGIPYGVWRDMGVSAEVLKRAGIER